MAKVKVPSVRLVRSKEDRKRPSVFMRLKTDEGFKAHALFEPDPEVENNPGYLEYYDHWDQQAQQYVPCAGEQCPFCHANDNPSTRALTVWFFPDGEKGEQLKVFTANWGTINALADEAEDEDGLIGKKMRVKRLSDKGEYRIKTLSEKGLTKSEVKKLMAEVEEMDLEGMVQKQLQVQMERLRALDALEDDDDDDEDDEDEDETPKRRRGKAIAEAEADEDDDEEEDDEEDEDEEDEEEESDEDEEDDDDEEDEEEDEEEEAEAISEVSYEVVSVDAAAETIDLKNDDGKVKMWFGADVEWEEDELTKGTTVEISAATDDEGDWVITDLSVIESKPKPKRGRPPKKDTKAKAAPKGKGKAAPKGKGRGKAKK